MILNNIENVKGGVDMRSVLVFRPLQAVSAHELFHRGHLYITLWTEQLCPACSLVCCLLLERTIYQLR